MATLERTPGPSALYDVLHADHARLHRAVVEVLSASDERPRERLWRRLAVDLTLHVRAVQDAILQPLAPTQPERIALAAEELGGLEQRVADAEAARPGPDFLGMVSELGRLLHQHAVALEGLLLPDAQAAMGPDEEDALIRAFEDRRDALRTRVEMEFGVGGVDVQWAEDIGEEREVGRPSQARSPKGGGDVTGDVTTIGARAERRARLVSGGADLRARTVTELHDLAKARGLEVVRGMSRDELLEILARAA